MKEWTNFIWPGIVEGYANVAMKCCQGKKGGVFIVANDGRITQEEWGAYVIIM